MIRLAREKLDMVLLCMEAVEAVGTDVKKAARGIASGLPTVSLVVPVDTVQHSLTKQQVIDEARSEAIHLQKNLTKNQMLAKLNNARADRARHAQLVTEGRLKDTRELCTVRKTTRVG